MEELVAEDVVIRQAEAVGWPDAKSGRLWAKLCQRQRRGRIRGGRQRNVPAAYPVRSGSQDTPDQRLFAFTEIRS